MEALFDISTRWLGTWLTIRIVTQTMKHLGIADFLIATEPMQILAIVLGSKLANHGGIVLALFVYVHFVPNLKLGQRYVFLSNHKIRPKVTAYFVEGGSQKWIEHRLVRMSKGGLQAVFRLQPAFADILGLFAYRDQVIVFLATLHEQILAVDEVLGCDRTVEGRELLLVKAHTVALDELAHLTLAGEDLPTLLTEDINGKLSELVAGDRIVGHVLEYIVERSLIKLLQRLAGRLAEEYVTGSDSHVEVLARVDHYRHLLGETTLQGAAARILSVLGDEPLNGFMVEVGEDADIALCLIVSHVEPELVEGIGRGALGVEPNVATLRLAKLLAIGLRDERTGDTEGFYVVAQSAMDQLSTRCHIAPLVVATQLQPDAMLAVEMEKVVTLEELVGKLSKGKSVARRTVETLLHALLRHHIVDSDVLTHLAGKVEEGEVLHPVVVVDHLGLVGRRAVEVKKLGCLLLDGLLIVVERLGVKEIALRTFA